MKNIVIYELNPEELLVFAIPESVVSTEELLSLKGVGFNYDHATDAQWEVHTKFANATDPAQYAEGVEKLEFPFSVPEGGQVFHILFGL